MRRWLRRLVLQNQRLRKLAESSLGRLVRRLILPSKLPLQCYDYTTQRLAERATLFAVAQRPGLLSLITTVWNTDAVYIRALADSVLSQEGGTVFEWFILDNGSTSLETIACLEQLSGHTCVRLERVEQNLGIIGGMRHCLERASNRYVLPLDSDDCLAADCMRVFTWFIRHYNYPPLLYSDEDKLEGELHRDAYFKPDWDPVLFVHSCYIAHLCAIDRELALKLGAYTDPRAEGCHDWDTFIRFTVAGHKPVHVSELLYSWRMHHQSTSSNIFSKPVVFDSHKHVLNRFLAARKSPELFSLEKSPLFGGTPDWWFRRRRRAERPLVTALMHRGDGNNPSVSSGDYTDHRVVELDMSEGLSAVRSLASSVAAEGGLLHLLSNKMVLEGTEWPWEALGLIELFPDTVMVGGRIFSPEREIVSAGMYFGFGRGCDCPDLGRSQGDPGYFAQMWKQHSVSAVSSQNAVIEPAFLVEVIDALLRDRRHASLEYLGAWTGAEARRKDLRVVYSPFLVATATQNWDELISETEYMEFVKANADIIPEQRLLSPHLGLDIKTAYEPVLQEARSFHLDALGVREKRNGHLSLSGLLEPARIDVQ